MRTLWVVIDRLMPILLGIGLLAPFIGVYVGIRLARRHEWLTVKAAAAVATRFGAGSVVFLVAAWASCNFPPSGRGVGAEDGYRRATPVITALQRYQADHGGYPDSLRALIPQYITEETLAAAETSISPSAFMYRRTETAYQVSFTYHGPAANRCTYVPGSSWECTRYW